MDSKFTACINVFINYIIKYFIKSENKAKTLQFDAPLAFFEKLNSSLALKLDVNSNMVVIKF